MAEINSKTDLIRAGYGGYEAWDETGALKNFQETGGQSKWDPSVAERLGLGLNLSEASIQQITNEIIDVINEYEDKLSTLGVPSLTDAEMETFLQKAIEQVKPYYDKKKAEIEAGIKEGRVRSMEDLLVEMREIRADISDELQRFDIEQSKTEDDLVNTLADITSSKEEGLESKRVEWRDRIRTTQTGQVQTGVFTSGIGQRKIRELLEKKEMEKGEIVRRAGTATTQAETSAQYSIDKITLAREGAQRERVRKLGTAEEEAGTEEKALGELGYTGIGDVPSVAEIERARADRNISVYRPEALTDITEESKRAIESRKLTLQQETLAQRQTQEEAERKKIQAEIAKKQREAARYGVTV